MSRMPRIAGLIAFALFAALTAGCMCPTCKPTDPHAIVFNYAWEGDIDESDIKEPSGIVYHSEEDCLFVAGDEGQLCRMKKDGTLVKMEMLKEGADLEGVTYDPATGLVYVAVEGKEQVLEVEPDSFEIKRNFQIDRKYRGETIFEPGGNGIEGITFKPDPSHPEGGVFLVANQDFSPGKDSFIAEVEVPLTSGGDTAHVRRVFHLGVMDLSGLFKEPNSGTTLVISDSTNTIWRIDEDGEIQWSYAITGQVQEGITMDDEGYMYIAQDAGGVIKIWPTEMLGPREEEEAK